MALLLARWWSLPALEQRQLALLALLLPAISLGLRLFGYKRTRAWLERWSVSSAPHAADASEFAAAERLAQLAAIAGRHGPIQQTCLRQALAVHAWLRRRGLQPEVKLGVGAVQGVPDMHAWVVLDGKALAQAAPRHVAFE